MVEGQYALAERGVLGALQARVGRLRRSDKTFLHPFECV
jgi:hypothetical protein